MLSALVLAQIMAVQAPAAPAMISIGDIIPHTASESNLRAAFKSNEQLVVEEVSAQRPSDKVVTVASEDRDFISTYFPFTVPENLHPELEDNLAVVWIVHALLGLVVGPLWIPTALTDIELGDDYQSEALINWLIHGIMFVATYVLLVIPVIGWIAFVAVHIGNLGYLFPLATISIANHHASGGGGKRKKKRRSAHLDLPGMSEAAAGAY